MVVLNNSLGKISFSEETLSSIVGISTMESYGVVGMATKGAKDGIWQLIRRGEKYIKGVKITDKKDSIVIELFIVVEYGTKISEIANNIIQKVKYNMEHLTGLKISSITVNVQGIRF